MSLLATLVNDTFPASGKYLRVLSCLIYLCLAKKVLPCPAFSDYRIKVFPAYWAIN